MNKTALILLGGAGLWYWEWRTRAVTSALKRLGAGEIGWVDVPIGASAGDDTRNTSTDDKWMDRLIEHRHLVQGWALMNLDVAASIMEVEIGNLPTNSEGSAGELGVFQVKPTTAEEMYNRGYTGMEPTRDVLRTVAGSIYYGTAYLDYLNTFGRGTDWIIAAYNGGPGWEAQGSSYRQKREEYRAKVKSRIERRKNEV